MILVARASEGSRIIVTRCDLSVFLNAERLVDNRKNAVKLAGLYFGAVYNEIPYLGAGAELETSECCGRKKP